MGTDGLRGVVVGDTTICTVGEGHDLFYRGYDIITLSKKAIFEEVVYLLLNTKLPNEKELNEFISTLKQKRQLNQTIKEVLEKIPASAHPMDVMRIGVSMLGIENPEIDFSKQYDATLTMLAAMPSIMCYWHKFVVNGQQINTDVVEAKTIAEHIFYMLNDRMPHPQEQKAMNISLILYAEHEMNASTFTARVVAATLADIYSTVAAAIGALKGPLHGGANEAVMDLLSLYKTMQEVRNGILQKLNNKEKIMGFGHAVYKYRDPRNLVIKEVARNLSSSHPNKFYFAFAEEIETLIKNEKNLFPNLDFYSACSYHFLNIPTYLFTPIFVCSRISGWCAHIFEQRANNKLIRPNANYTGIVKADWINLKDRP